VIPFFAWVLGFLSLAFIIGCYLGYHRGVHVARTDPAHIDRLARKDRRIAELEHSLAKVKQQRNATLEAYRRERDRKAVG
jgi:hypothetical protein